MRICVYFCNDSPGIPVVAERVLPCHVQDSHQLQSQHVLAHVYKARNVNSPYLRKRNMKITSKTKDFSNFQIILNYRNYPMFSDTLCFRTPLFFIEIIIF